MAKKTITAPARMIHEVCILRGTLPHPFEDPEVIGRFAPRIDYPGGIDAFAAMVWQSVVDTTDKSQTRFCRRVQVV